jgi:hypothetical protein
MCAPTHTFFRPYKIELVHVWKPGLAFLDLELSIRPNGRQTYLFFPFLGVLSPSLLHRWQTFPIESAPQTNDTTGQKVLFKGKTSREKKKSTFLAKTKTNVYYLSYVFTCWNNQRP